MIKNLPAMQETQVQSQVRKIPWTRAWQPTPVFFPGEFHGLRSLRSYSPWGHKDSDMTEQLLWERDIRNLEQKFRSCLGAANVALAGVEMAGINTCPLAKEQSCLSWNYLISLGARLNSLAIKEDKPGNVAGSHPSAGELWSQSEWILSSKHNCTLPSCLLAWVFTLIHLRMVGRHRGVFFLQFSLENFKG